ncbi:Dpy-30 motif [Mactra antiquata]
MAMATSTYKTGDDTYGSALQRVMKECLPPILVEIADKRPSDPIEYLAHSLYKYREKEEQELQEQLGDTASMERPNHNRMPSKMTDKYSKLTNSDKTRQVTKGLIVDGAECDDFIEEDSIEMLNISNKMVHEHCMYVLKQIGDIFDDDDIS